MRTLAELGGSRNKTIDRIGTTTDKNKKSIKKILVNFQEPYLDVVTVGYIVQEIGQIFIVFVEVSTFVIHSEIIIKKLF